MSTHKKRPFQEPDPSDSDHQYLEDLSCAYWHSEVLFAALELRLFDHIESSGGALSAIAAAGSFREEELLRLLIAMDRMELVGEHDGHWYNGQAARRFLLSDSPGYMGDFFLYRRYMQENWRTLAKKVSAIPAPIDPQLTENAHVSKEMPAPEDEVASEDFPPSGKDDYAVRNYNYVRTLDALARRKSEEIVRLLSSEKLSGPLLDIGGGAGSVGRALLARLSGKPQGVLFDLPEVIDAAGKLYPDRLDWKNLRTLSGDFRSHRFSQEDRYGLIVMGNFLHAYGKEAAETLLRKAARLLLPGGKILIHDYFPDRTGRSPQKGPLYDLAMMLNTYDGACHTADDVTTWLASAGLEQMCVRDLETDSTVILAGEEISNALAGTWKERWEAAALACGFRKATAISTEAVVTGAWVRKKCRFGCSGYAKSLQCPPHGMTDQETRRMLDGYERAVLVEGAPPGKSFHKSLLDLEKKAFLEGYYKAFVFGAGPCTLCPSCPQEGPCRHTDLARPAMEASGIDVYETAKNAGLPLSPVREKTGYVKYLGLLLLE